MLKTKYFYAFTVTEDLLFGALAHLEALELPLKQVLPGLQEMTSRIASPDGRPQMVPVFKILTKCEVSKWPEIERKLKAIGAGGVKALMSDVGMMDMQPAASKAPAGKVLAFPGGAEPAGEEKSE